MTDPLLFFLAALALLTAPGPTNTLLAASGAIAGLRASLLAIGAALAAYLAAIAAYLLVLAPVFAAHAVAGIALKVLVAFYVIWLAIRLWQSSAHFDGTKVGVPDVFIATLLNPKALIAALTILPAGNPAMAWYVAAFAAIVIVAGTGWVMLGRFVARSAGEKHQRLIPRVASVLLVGFAGLIAASALG